VSKDSTQSDGNEQFNGSPPFAADWREVASSVWSGEILVDPRLNPSPAGFARLDREIGFALLLARDKRGLDVSLRWRDLAGVVLMTSVIGACRSSVAPSSLSLKAGTNMLTITGFDAGDPGYPLCGPVFAPPAGKQIITLLDLQFEASEWIGRSISPGASLELHIQAAGTSTFGDLVTGTAKGIGPDAALGSIPARNVVVVVGTLARPMVTLQGTVTRDGSMIIGQMAGAISFTDSNGSVGTCSNVELLLRPAG